jgi:hypothetical protein
MSSTKKNRGKGRERGKGRGIATRGWKNQKPGYHQRSVMLKNCGQKCFLGTKKSFPICKKNTCKISPQGVYSAYIRARQYRTRGNKYKNISKKANKMLLRMGVKR